MKRLPLSQPGEEARILEEVTGKVKQMDPVMILMILYVFIDKQQSLYGLWWRSPIAPVWLFFFSQRRQSFDRVCDFISCDNYVIFFCI